ncbi:MAG: hypothetical protein AB7S71_06445 [Dongiaceae bacterium]
MTNTHLLLLSQHAGRFAPRRQPAAQVPAPSLWRPLVRIARWLRPRPRLPYLSEHLCRDIGIDPMPKPRDWPLTW